MTTELFALQEKITSLQDALLSKHPRMPSLLHEIHKTLQAQPENVVLLSPQEISQIVSGLKEQTKVEFAAAALKPAAAKSAAAKIKALGADAF